MGEGDVEELGMAGRSTTRRSTVWRRTTGMTGRSTMGNRTARRSPRRRTVRRSTGTVINGGER